MTVLLIILDRIHVLLAYLLWPVQLFYKAYQKRWLFEGRNLEDGSFSEPFSHPDVHRLYHLSSEGEWEQVIPFIEKDLEHKNAIEIVITSESLELKLQALLSQESPEYLRVRRLNLVRRGIGKAGLGLANWSRARSVFLCRYDFYPELLLLGKRALKRDGVFGLFAASLIGKDQLLQNRFSLKRWYLKKIHQMFSLRVLSSPMERQRFELLTDPVENQFIFDARDRQILKRLSLRQSVLNDESLEGLMTWLKSTSRFHRLIAGSFWPHELALFQSQTFTTWLQGLKFRLVIVPHQLNSNEIKKMLSVLSSHGFRTIISNGRDFIHEDVNIVILNRRGVLVELYSEFDWAYVGGGFGRSIHSVKEPYLAQCHVLVGPKTFRSSEWEDILSKAPQKATSFQAFNQFEDIFRSLLKNPPVFVKPGGHDYTQAFMHEEEKVKQLFHTLVEIS
jgi:3-deoxy-D-manno-octulosonic-acid transferase